MQNKGLVKLFALMFGLVSIYQLSFTFKANQIEKKASAIANGDQVKERKYLDSLTNEKVFDIGIADFTYKEVKDKELKKGLDL